MTFLNPMMLLFGLATAIPIALHIWNRKRTTRVRWAASRFIEEAVRESSRRIRLERIILLIIRSAILAILAIALARPIFSGAAVAPNNQHVVLMLDASLSMQADTGVGTCFAVAKQRLRQVVEQSVDGTHFSLCVIGEPCDILIWYRATRLTVLDELQSTNVQDGLGNAKEAIDLVRLQLTSSRPDRDLPTRVVIASDFCENTWSDVSSAAIAERSGEAYELIDVGIDSAENAAILSATLAEGYAVTSRPATFLVELRNTSDRAFDSQLSIEPAAQSMGETTIHIPANDTVQVPITTMFRQSGFHQVEIHCSDDILPADNVFRMVIPVKNRLQVLCVESATGAADYIDAALAVADDSLVITREPAERIPESLDFDAIVLSDASAMTEIDYGRLKTYVMEGGILIVSAGPATRQIPEASRNAALLFDALGDEASAGEYRIDDTRLAHPALAPFRAQSQSGLTGSMAWKYRKLTTGDRDDVMLYFANSDPAILLSDRGLGRVVYFASSIAPSRQFGSDQTETWTTLPVLPAFVPLAHRTFAFAQSVRLSTRTLKVGDSITGPNPSPRKDSTFTIIREGSDDVIELVNADSTAANWVSTPISRTGFYHAKSLDENVFSVAFNIDPIESDLTKTELSRLPGWLTTPPAVAVSSPRFNSNDGAGDWSIVPLLSAVVCLLLLETVATGWEAPG